MECISSLFLASRKAACFFAHDFSFFVGPGMGVEPRGTLPLSYSPGPFKFSC